MPDTIRKFTLCQYENESPFYESTMLTVNDELMVFDTRDAAVAMALWFLEGGQAEADANGILPFLAIMGHDHDPATTDYGDPDGDPQSWTEGWVDLDGAHDGDHEAAPFWNTLAAPADDGPAVADPAAWRRVANAGRRHA